MLADTRSKEHQMSARTTVRTPHRQPVVLAESVLPPIRTEAIHFATAAASEFWDLTDLARGVVTRSRVGNGQVTMYTPHTTTSIVVNETEGGFFNDFRKAINALVPEDVYYEHDDHQLRTENLQPDELVNGHAHCRQLLVGQPSVTIPVVGGKLLLGRWQRILFVELDQARERRAYFHAHGV